MSRADIDGQRRLAGHAADNVARARAALAKWPDAPLADRACWGLVVVTKGYRRGTPGSFEDIAELIGEDPDDVREALESLRRGRAKLS